MKRKYFPPAKQTFVIPPKNNQGIGIPVGLHLILTKPHIAAVHGVPVGMHLVLTGTVYSGTPHGLHLLFTK